MAERSAERQRLKILEESASRRANSMLWAPLLASAAPFLPGWAYGLGGGLIGHRIAKLMDERKRLGDQAPASSAFDFKAQSRSGLVTQSYLGHSMDFLSYKSGLEALRADRGGLTAEQRKTYSNACISRMSPMFMADSELTRHMCVLGSPGNGKTELCLSLAYQQIARGGGMMIFDPKSDIKVFLAVAEMARMFYREHDLYYFNPDQPHLSHKYNPLLRGNARQVVSTSMKLTKTPSGGGDEFFYRMTRLGLLAAIVCLMSQPERRPFSFKDLAPLFSDLRMFIRLWQQIPEHNQPAREFVYQFLSMWVFRDQRTGELQINENKYHEILMGLKQMVMDFCHSEYYDLINSYSPDIELKDIIMNSKILYIGFSALADKQGSNVFGRLLMADLARAMGEIYQDRTRAAVPFVVFMDEYGSSADEADNELFQMGRDANISIVAAVQGRGFLDKVSREFTDNLLATTANHLYLRVNDPSTRETAAELAGSTITKFGSESVGRQFGKSHKNFELGLLNQESHGRSVGRSARESREDLLQPEDFNMERGDAVLIGQSGVFRMRLPMVSLKHQARDASEVRIPKYDHLEVQGMDLMQKHMKSEASQLLNLIDGED